MMAAWADIMLSAKSAFPHRCRLCNR